MVLLPRDYLKGANGMDHKPPLNLIMKVIKYLPDEQRLCVNEQKKEGFQKVQPYHPNANAELVTDGEPLPIEEGCGATTHI